MKTTLCACWTFSGAVKVTFSPTAISTASSPSAVSWKKLSPTKNVASARGDAPDANAGTAITATTSTANHGKTDFLNVSPKHCVEPETQPYAAVQPEVN